MEIKLDSAIGNMKWTLAKQLLHPQWYDGFTLHKGVYHGTAELTCPHATQGVLRMLVRYRDGELQLPEELEWVRPLIIAADKVMLDNGLVMPFTYVTVRHNFETDHTDEDWHVDGFSLRVSHIPEQNFLWSNTGGTLFTGKRVLVADNFNAMKHNINTSVKFIGTGADISAAPNGVYSFDPYVFHKAPPYTGKGRTFVRISYTAIEIDDVNNTPNPLLPRVVTRRGVEFRNTLTSAFDDV